MKNKLESLIIALPEKYPTAKALLHEYIVEAGFDITYRTLENYINIPTRRIDAMLVDSMLDFFNTYKKEGEEKLTIKDFFEKPKKQDLAKTLGMTK